jgi:hypothetical protein
MNSILVSIGAPAEGSRLCPQYDESADILAVTSDSAADWVYGVDIDGNVVFDLDAGRRLANFDLHIGKRLWSRGSVRPWPEKPPPAGTIIFSNETIEQKSLNMLLRLVYDPVHRALDVRFGTTEPTAELELSRDCIALLAGSELVGFSLRTV